MASLGVVAGVGLGALDRSAVAVPVVGPVPGWVLSAAGLLVVGVGLYRQKGQCGCAGDCGDSCSV